MPRDVTGRFTIVEAGDPLEPIDRNATCGRRLRPRLDGALVLLLGWGHLPVPLTLSPKAGSTGRYAKRFLRAFEYLRSRDGLMFAKQPRRSRLGIKLGDA